ncbi:hypothetical protein J2S53_000254 [Actinopolyspora lacussalsi]|nr:hypothetical protein [Actinopolyspora lacussalsi]
MFRMENNLVTISYFPFKETKLVAEGSSRPFRTTGRVVARPPDA